MQSAKIFIEDRQRIFSVHRSRDRVRGNDEVFSESSGFITHRVCGGAS
jgi:hypothetical protein